MPLIITPGQLVKRAELYHQLGQLMSAGIGLVRALEQIKRNPPQRSDREPITRLIEELARGRTFAESIVASNWLPDFDLALLHAGEQSGRLDQCFRLLADYYNSRARIARQVISQLLYPLGMLHFAVFVFGVVLPFAKNGMNFDASLILIFIKAALWLLPLYLGIALLIFAFQSKHGEKWRATIDALLHPIPVLGTARHYLALARLATALEALISAGVNIIEAWDIAAAASGSPALHRIVLSWQSQLAAGRTPADLVTESRRFPEMFSNFYATGEVSGKLDDSLRKLRQYYLEEGERKLQNLANLAPKAVYFIIMICIAFAIIRFYNGLYGNGSDLDKAIKGFRD